eukprot:CAMPEP_0202696346 /NCGR_PEP_ID=MMETSP1385-20130828/9635_1 /ASSEMBLY_ACC=CAM_ASM_000861 /TAXON_ID=933848 /ORGANISM="Elphidium margaritaceum" /LENGTH=189 /DNA_ID=CAMNT_0049352491 /DNA_START=106 /DNA_END=675 /DNA_ORIENTATION=-
MTNLSYANLSFHFDDENISEWLESNSLPLSTQNAFKVFHIRSLKDLASSNAQQIQSVCNYLAHWPEYKRNHQLNSRLQNAVCELKDEANRIRVLKFRKRNSNMDVLSNEDIIPKAGHDKKKKKRKKCGHCSNGRRCCTHCGGMGYKATEPPTACIKCHATGQVVCEDCGGFGYKRDVIAMQRKDRSIST